MTYLGLPFRVQGADIDETPLPDETPQDMVLRLSHHKSEALARLSGDEPGVVVAADTTVVLDGANIGKPRDPEEAVYILKRLRGRAHHVYTGLSLAKTGAHGVGDGHWSALCHTLVHMRDYSDDELRAYVASGSPLDKAGAYAIQDRNFHPVIRIEGCYLNVMGLPLCELIGGLRELGVAVAAREPAAHDCLSATGEPCLRSDSQSGEPHA